MRFSVIVALVGSTAAIKVTGCGNGAAANYCAPAPAEQAGYNCDDQVPLPLPQYSGNLDASCRIPKPGAGGADGYAKLCAESAESSTAIAANQITVPDKNIVTDQAKVHEAVAKGEKKSQTCQVARRKFSINGEITVDEKYNDNLKGDETSKKCGQGASQTRSRTQLLNSCAVGAVAIPRTSACVESNGCTGSLCAPQSC
jgi:hypothetical protein